VVGAVRSGIAVGVAGEQPRSTWFVVPVGYFRAVSESTLREQLILHDASQLCAILKIRPAGMDHAQMMAAFGLELDREGILAELAPALRSAWPDHPEPDEDLISFCDEAYERIITRASDLAGEHGFVPAARWLDRAREVLLEHLRLEVDAIVGGARAEELWFAFGAVPDTQPLYDLVHAGLMIKLRAVADFLIGSPSSHHDELRAAQFFPVGEWEAARDSETTAELKRIQTLVHKQIAHLTMTRPPPEERDVYRPSTYRYVVGTAITLLEAFTQNVDHRLLTDWWTEWLAGLRGHLDPWPFAVPGLGEN
jgi:hypothetical protein